MGKMIVCGPENVTEFRATMKEVMPEFYEAAKALHKLGMIDGLRGARIELLEPFTAVGEHSQDSEGKA